MKHIYTFLIALFIGSFGFTQTTVSYSFSSSANTSGSLDINISFATDSNSSSNNPAVFSNQLRLYQNATKGGSIIITPSNGATITNVTVYASSRTGDAGYTVDGGSATNLSGGSTYTMSSISANTEVEFYQRESGSGNRIYVDSFEVTYTMPTTCTAPISEATAFSASNVTTDAATLSWTRGIDGDNVIVIMKEGAAVDFSPSSDTAYGANTDFSSGTELGTGNYVIYNGAGTSEAITGLASNTIYYIAIYEYNNTDTCYMSTALTDSFTTLANTTVEFTGTTASVSESIGSYDLVIEIANEDVAATTFDVVLTSGDATDIDSYTTQSETFLGSSTTDVTVTITVTDDAIIENDEMFTFEIQNVAGGNSAAAGTNNTFDLTITNNDFPTIVEFISSSASVSEGVGTYDLEFTIANESATATSFDVVLTGGDGDAADINSYTTQTVTFPSGSAVNQIVTLTVSDDTDFEADETLSFEIQNITGGSSAVVGTNNSFTLTLTNNDVTPPITLPYNEDFSNCGTAEWTAFDEAGSNSWYCNSDEYTMNGYPSTNDIDWLISDFTIDFDSYASVNIEVTTSEKYGNAINEAGEFELVYSTDYSGSGDPSIATWTPLTFDPNNTSTSGSASSDDTTVVDASSITGTAYIAFIYDANNGSGAEEWNITNILIEEIATSTSVQFVSTAATVEEDAGTYNLEFSILNEDTISDTTFDVVLISGDNTDIDGYTTQTVTFAAGSSTNQTITITVTDDLIDEGDETLTFVIQNVSGGDSAAAGSVDSFDLTISVSDTPIPAAGWQITSENTLFVIDFDTTVTDVNNGAFDGSGFRPTPNSGELDTDAWASTGMDDGDMDFGDTKTSGDYARGTSTGNVSSGGFYAFDTGSGNSTLGFQATGNDFTPGTITLRAQNQTGNTVTAADLTYLIYVDNRDGRSNSLDISYSTDDLNYTDVSALDYTSDASSDGLGWVSNSKSTSITGLSIADGAYLYLRWSTAEVSGSGNRDEFALDDISLKFNPVASTPITYTYNGTWSPSDPNGTATASDDIVITSGNAIISSDTAINSVTVKPGAALTVNTSTTLTITDAITLESVSNSYSSLLLDGTIVGTINYERHVNGNTILEDANAIGNNDLITPPLSGQTFGAFADANSNLIANPGDATEKAFAIFDKSTGDYENYNTTDNVSTLLVAGTGYRAASNNTSTLVFTGTANSGDVNINIDHSGPSYQEWNLIGNPYPSYLNIKTFLTYEVAPGIKNIDLLGDTSGIYGYDGEASNGWDIINLANASGRFMTPGQGFLVGADATYIATNDLEFKATMRTTGSGDDFIVGRNANTLTYFKLNARTTTQNFSTQFYFNANATKGLDSGYDATIWGGTAPNFSLFSHLVEDNSGLPIALQTLDVTDLSNITIPLGVNANQGEQLTFSINASTLPSTVSVYLEDNVTNTSTLLNTNDYVLTPGTVLSGTGRFYLHVSNSTLSTIDTNLDQLSIYTDKADKTIVIAGQLIESTTATVYDVQGRLVSATQLQTALRSQTIDVSQLNAGIYIVKLHNGVQNKTQKVILR